MMGLMADMRRRSPEPPPGAPQTQFKPGLADQTLRELAPLLAAEGVDVDDIDAPDLTTLQAAMNRAVERHNMARFTPVGHARDPAVATLPLAVEAIAEGDTTLAAAILEQVEPESPDNTVATVAGCIGVALGLLDDWLSGAGSQAPNDLGQRLRLPAGHWLGEHAATDILVLARKGRAFRSLSTLVTNQGGAALRQCPRKASSSHQDGWSRTTFASMISGLERPPDSHSRTGARSATRRTVTASKPNPRPI